MARCGSFGWISCCCFHVAVWRDELKAGGYPPHPPFFLFSPAAGPFCGCGWREKRDSSSTSSDLHTASDLHAASDLSFFLDLHPLQNFSVFRSSISSDLHAASGFLQGELRCLQICTPLQIFDVFRSSDCLQICMPDFGSLQIFLLFRSSLFFQRGHAPPFLPHESYLLPRVPVLHEIAFQTFPRTFCTCLAEEVCRSSGVTSQVLTFPM